ncbi:protein ccpA [Aspergillus stella-maris]|uniref:protein ccpA n=1 Tax=Aspergillus stella-maris TaxID=1810926 RepID=UPI003CCCBDA7
MHFTSFLLASALALAPTITAYGVATVDIHYHEACSNGEKPHNEVDTSESAPATKDTCTALPAKHSFDIDAYTFEATPITPDTDSACHAVGIYKNDECVGHPVTVVPLWPGEKEAESTCIRDDYFEDQVFVKLFCEEGPAEHEGH